MVANWYSWIKEVLDVGLNYLIIKHTFNLLPPRQFAIHHFEGHHSKGPNVAEEGVLVVLKCLRRHVIRRADIVIVLLSY